MSFIRPRWLDDIVKPAPSASPRLRGLKGFEPHHIPALQDVLYSDDPTFWVLSRFLAAGGAGALGHIGVQTPNDDSMVVCVDGALVENPGAASEDFIVEMTIGGTALPALIADTNVFKRNRRENARTTAAEKTGLLAIVDNAVNLTQATTIGAVRLLPNTSLLYPIGVRLFGFEALDIRNATLNVPIEVTMWGRMTTKGQR